MKQHSLTCLIKKSLVILTSLILILCINSGNIKCFAEETTNDENITSGEETTSIENSSDIDDSYYYKNIEMNIVVHDDNTYTVTEGLDVYFNEEKHGIIRSLPETFSVKLYNDFLKEDVEYNYLTPIKWMKVDGAKYSLDSDSNVTEIKIGDADKTVIGDVHYDISYKYDFGDDRYPDFDLFYYNIIGTQYNTSVDKLDFSITFEKDTDLSKFELYVIEKSGTVIENIDVNENTISGTVTNIKPFEAVTGYIKLDENYYVNTSVDYDSTYAYIVLVLIIISSSVAVFFKLRCKNRKVVQTVEFNPPAGITSAEAGYIIDGIVDKEDLVSLFFYMAKKGYINIKVDKKDIYLTKTGKKLVDEPNYVKTLYKGIFKTDEKSIAVRKLDNKFVDAASTASTMIEIKYDCGRGLGNSFFKSKSVWLSAINAILMYAGTYLCGGVIDEDLQIFPLFMAAGFFIMSIFGNNALRFRYFPRRRRRNIVRIIISVIILLLNYGNIMWSIEAAATFNVGLVAVLIILFGLIGIICATLIHKDTDLKIDYTGKLLGLKEFIKAAEEDRIRVLSEENPEYFYDILPYAYVFGLANIWAVKFKDIVIDKPGWYYNDNDETFNCMAFTVSVSNACNTANRRMALQSFSNTTSSSGGSSSSGGYSGGGGGGGGSSSW